jgi:hypothetical protein
VHAEEKEASTARREDEKRLSISYLDIIEANVALSDPTQTQVLDDAGQAAHHAPMTATVLSDALGAVQHDAAQSAEEAVDVVMQPLLEGTSNLSMSEMGMPATVEKARIAPVEGGFVSERPEEVAARNEQVRRATVVYSC